jgi:hypothetical protein
MVFVVTVTKVNLGHLAGFERFNRYDLHWNPVCPAIKKHDRTAVFDVSMARQRLMVFGV